MMGVERAQQLSAPSHSLVLRIIMSATPNQVQISGQIQLADLDALKAAGIGTVINNRPDEAPDQPSSQEVEAKAAELGMKYFMFCLAERADRRQS